MRRPLALLILLLTAALVLGACSDDDGGSVREVSDDSTPSGSGSASGSGSGSGSGSSSETGSAADFCTTVEENVEVATGEDLQAAIPAIEAMADAAPSSLQDAFEENLAALEPVAEAPDAETATSVFVEQVADAPAYTDSLTQIGDGIEEECGIDISSAAG